jgi:hypothetical protein
MHRRATDHDATTSQPIPQFVQCLVGRLRNQLAHQHLMGRQSERPIATHPAGLKTAGLFPLLDQLDRRTLTDRKTIRRRSARRPIFNRSHDPFANIQRKRCCHSSWPPPSPQLESHFRPIGNPPSDSN